MDKNTYLVGLSESDATDFGRVDFADQSPEQRVFSAVWTLESEVNNGGFLQYFENDRGETALFAAEALKRIGAHRCATIVERAIGLLPSSFPSDPHAVESMVERLRDEKEDEFADLDQAFSEYPDNLSDLLFKFVQQHPQTFGQAPAGIT